MTPPKTDTFQFKYLLDDVRAAVPLEVMIRAVGRAMPDRMEELQRLDAGMQQAWRDAGFSDQEIAFDQHVEEGWDFIQLGWSETRQIGRVWPRPHLAKLVQQTHEQVHKAFANQVDATRYPFAVRFRYADLLRGMNVERVLHEFDRKRAALAAKPQNSDQSVPLSNFVGPLRRVVPVIPGVKQHVRFGPELPDYAGIMLRTDMPIEDVEAALQAFRFHYALARIRDGDQSRVPGALLQPWTRPSVPSVRQKANVDQGNQIRSLLNGLYCYDRFRFHEDAGAKHPAKLAFEDAQALKGDDTLSRDTLTKQLKVIRVKIDEAVESLAE